MSRKNIEKLITNHKQRLQILKEKQALQGLDTPPNVLLEIQQIEIEIEQLETQLEALEASPEPEDAVEIPTPLRVSWQTSEIPKAVKEYDLRKIYVVLKEGFTVDALRTLCLVCRELRPIYDEISAEATKDTVILHIMEFVERQLLHEVLLTEIARDNPKKFEQYKPYLLQTEPDQTPVVEQPTPSKNPIPPRPSQRPAAPTRKYISNPFHYGGPVLPENFVGHQWAVDFCQAKLAARQRTNIAISGERRIGKTSLLHYLKAYGIEIEWGQNQCLFIECGLLDNPVTSTNFWQVVLDRLDEKLDIYSSLAPEIIRLQQQPELGSEEIRDFLYLYRQIYPDQPIILLLDEFELIFKSYNDDIGQLLTVLSSLTRDVIEETTKLQLVTATRDDLLEVCQPHTKATGLEFHSSFVPCQLTPFEKNETNYVVETLLSGTEIEFTETELDHIWQLSQLSGGGSLPIFVQVAASLIFEYKQRYQGSIDFFYLKRQFEKQVRLYRQDTPATAPTMISQATSSTQLTTEHGTLNYEQALSLLKEHIVAHHPTYLLDFYEMAQQLRKNLEAERQFELNATLQHDRTIIIQKLSALSLEVLGDSFYKLAMS